MGRVSARSLLFLGFAVVLLGVFNLVGPTRAVLGVRCFLDNSLQGNERSTNGVVVRLPTGWCEQGRGDENDEKITLIRVPRDRSASRSIAVVGRLDADIDGRALEARRGELKYTTEHYGQWQAREVADIVLGDVPAFEVRFSPMTTGTDLSALVASDFVVPQRHVLVSCFPMTPPDLEECREVAATASARFR